MGAHNVVVGVEPPTNYDRDRLKQDWAAQLGVRQSRSDWAKANPLEWLFGKRPPSFDPNYWRPWWMDHGTCWVREGKPFCVLGQPYHLTDEADDLFEECRRLGLVCVVASSPSWHYPGGVLSVIVAKTNIFLEVWPGDR